MSPTLLHGLDRLRRWQGSLLDAAGFGPVEAPWRLLAERPGFRLRCYGGPAGAPALVIVPAPIKQPYIWDLAPGSSVVRRCLDAGLRVYLVAWTPPPEEAVLAENGSADHGTGDLGLADYAGRLLAEALDIAAADSGRDSFTLAGHSLGGTLIALFAALRPERVRDLVLIEAPLAFADRAGRFAPWVAAAPDAGRVADRMGTVPGSFLNLASAAAAPDAFLADVARDRLLSFGDPEAATLHARVRRWTLDEFPMPGRLFADVVELLYRRDLFARDALDLEGRRIGARDLTMPIVAVVDPESAVVPAQSTLAALAHAEVHVLDYRGDPGVALRHVGALVGRSAHRDLWPGILTRLAARNEPPSR